MVSAKSPNYWHPTSVIPAYAVFVAPILQKFISHGQNVDEYRHVSVAVLAKEWLEVLQLVLPLPPPKKQLYGIVVGDVVDQF